MEPTPPAEFNRDSTPIFWKREITVGQALGFSITILTLIFTGWMDMRIQLAEHETRITTLENGMEKILERLDKSSETDNKNHIETINALNDLKVQLTRKQDRD